MCGGTRMMSRTRLRYGKLSTGAVAADHGRAAGNGLPCPLPDPSPRALRLGEGRDPVSPEFGHEAGKHPGRENGVGPGPVPFADFHAQPGRNGLKRPVRKVRRERRDEFLDVDRPRGVPGKAVAPVFRFEDGEVEADRETDDERRTGPGGQRRHGFRETRRSGNITVRNSVNAGGSLRDRNAGFHETGKGVARVDRARNHANGAELDHPVPRGIEAGRFRVQKHRVERTERQASPAIIRRKKRHGDSCSGRFRSRSGCPPPAVVRSGRGHRFGRRARLPGILSTPAPAAGRGQPQRKTGRIQLQSGATRKSAARSANPDRNQGASRPRTDWRCGGAPGIRLDTFEGRQ